jgi:hypothetical protein
MKKFSQEARDNPFHYIMKAISLLEEMGGETIVEIGTMRKPVKHKLNETRSCCNDGHSTLLFALTGMEFYSVDVNKRATKLAQNTMVEHGCTKNSSIINGDGIDFLKNFSKKIDLLFLDAWDVGKEGYDEKHKEAYLVAKDKLSDKHLILIDDTDIDIIDGEHVFIEDHMSGKGKLLIPLLLEEGYEIVFGGRQTLLKNFRPLEES